jgi:LysR family hydrogen peroxide-inducible transcriptional activator
MNLRDLEYVVALAKAGSFSRAAEACAVSQPTLSLQIKKLEDELGIALFERNGRTIGLTATGKKILAFAETAVNAATDLRRAATADRDPLVGPLRIGIIPSLAPYALPVVLPAVREALPTAPLVIVEEPTAALTARLADGDLDGALLATEMPGFIEAPIAAEALFAALPAAHPLAKRAAISLDDVDPATILLLDDGHCLRDHALALCSHPDRARSIGGDMRAASLETLLNLVRAGYGVTVVPALALAGRMPLAGVTIRPLSGAPVRDLRLAYRRNAPRRAALDLLAAVLRREIGSAPIIEFQA